MADRVWTLPAGAALLLLSGCGGGGGVNSTGTPASGSTGTTTIPTTPVINYNDAEYTRSNSATDASAISAWNAGSTGAGITIAILDTGLSDPTGQFTGRISSASTSLSDSAGYADQDGHGTAIAAVAAAARNASDIEGLAFGATVMALRTDNAGSCATTAGCAFSTAALATAVDYAVTNGAKVINMSLGGSPATTQMRAAINRATSAGVIIVIAGGNDGDAEPDILAQIAADPIAHGLVIIAGAHDASGAISSFSDKAGTFAPYYITALGTDVRSFDNKGADYLYSGTSFSAPAVAAAVALIEAAFPNLTPAQVINLIYASATDAGAAGVDSTFGHGLLNLVKAFQPIGTSSLAGSTAAVSLTQNAVLSGAMGDATMAGSGLDRTIILDGYGRAFSVNLAGTVAHIGQRRPLTGAIGGALVTRNTQEGPLSVSLTMARDLAGEPWAGFGQRGLTANGQIQARTVTATATMAIDRDTIAGFGFATSGRRLGDLIDGGEGSGGAYLVARSPTDGPGFDGNSGMATAFRHRFGRLAIDVTAERGALAALLRGERESAYTMMTMRATRTFGPLALGIGTGLLDEDRTVLGSRFGALLGGRGASTRTAELDARLNLGRGWSLHAARRQGWTSTATGGALVRGRLQSIASAFDIGRTGGATQFGLRYSEPLRVTHGGFGLSVPTGYDYSTLSANYTLTNLNLAPTGHERDLEASYGLQIWGGWLDTNLYLRTQPGNIALAPNDVGGAIRYGINL
ncbi:S8 family peptidase [Sphingomonas sp. MMS24-J13]|uniref:S8 family peptidase n=1 Tax=Sphingomonas sp. MMS24-J13 TaxID=3238686 RepID=UPI00384DDEBB